VERRCRSWRLVAAGDHKLIPSRWRHHQGAGVLHPEFHIGRCRCRTLFFHLVFWVFGSRRRRRRRLLQIAWRKKSETRTGARFGFEFVFGCSDEVSRLGTLRPGAPWAGRSDEIRVSFYDLLLPTLCHKYLGRSIRSVHQNSHTRNVIRITTTFVSHLLLLVWQDGGGRSFTEPPASLL
jgi:hypothetical protein